MAAIQILSDLHLEAPDAYETYEIIPSAPYLALLGDIGNVGKPGHLSPMLDFLQRQVHAFRVVFFIPGNHEAYHSTWPTTLSLLRDFENNIAQKREADPALGQFVLMDRGYFRLPSTTVPSGLGDTMVLGCSLFSKVPGRQSAIVEMSVNDFHLTGEDWTVKAHSNAHDRDVAWLNQMVCLTELDPTIRCVVILTHWSPTVDRSAIDPVHRGSEIASAFSTDLTNERCWMAPKVRVWACGHTHYNFDFRMARRDAAPIRVLTNQRGYDWEQAARFDAQKAIRL